MASPYEITIEFTYPEYEDQYLYLHLADGKRKSNSSPTYLLHLESFVGGKFHSF